MNFRCVALMALASFVGLQPHAGAQTVDLGSAWNYGILAGTTITNTGDTTINGNLGVSPGITVTGFPPGVLINGTSHLGDSGAIQALADASTANSHLSALTFNTSLTGQDLGGLTLAPGVYNFSSTAQLTGLLKLDGAGVYVFQIGSTLTTASASVIELMGGATASNVFWRVGSSATLGTSSDFEGTVLADQSITVGTGVTDVGRLFALNGATTLDSDVITSDVITAVPEPADTALLVAGFAGLAVCAARIRKHRSGRRLESM